MKSKNTVLTIAGVDPSSGAGIFADCKTISSLGSYALCVVSAVTCQNTCKVTDIQPINVDIIEEQINLLVQDFRVDAVKIGMLFSNDIINKVSDCITKYNLKNIVLDPVMISTSGNALLKNDAIDSLKEKLFPKASIITPNLPEAEFLLQRKITSQDELPKIAEQLALKYNSSVLIKAGHFESEFLTDVFLDFDDKTISYYQSKKIISKNTHGTGCTLSSAIASFISQGYDKKSAIKQAHDYLFEAILAAKDNNFGNGHGPVEHFYNFF